jgi:curved DNA-binding protein
MNYYNILGVPQTASVDEIKACYRRLARKHHPDKGGDTATFQAIAQAYDVLSTPEKRHQYDRSLNINERRFTTNVNDFFNFTFTQTTNRQRNRDVTIKVTIPFKTSFSGTQLEAKYKTPSGSARSVIVDIPPGIESGQTIQYQGLGDDLVASLPRGHLHVYVEVTPDNEYERRGSDIYKKVTISLVEAMAGCQKEVTLVDESTLNIVVPPGTQSGTEISIPGNGFLDLRTRRVGDFYTIINVDIPAVTDPQLIDQLTELYSRIIHNNSSI